MALSPDKLRAIVNLLSDPLQAHAAAHRLAEEAKERRVLVADLISEALGPGPPKAARAPPIPPGEPELFDNGVSAIGRPLNLRDYGLRTTVLRETAMAWLVEWPSGEDVWLPKSQCQHKGLDVDGRVIFIIPVWLLKRKALL
jgi:hypothetical protein